MAKSTHDKQLERAREKRRQDALSKRRGRSRILVIALVVLLVLALVGFALTSGGDGGTPTVSDEPTTTEDGDAAQDATDAADDGAASETDGDGSDAGEPDAGDPDAEADAETDEVATGERPEGACPPTPDDVPEVTSTLYDDAPEMTIDEDATYTATIATTCGDIVVELDAEGAPATVNNFVFLAEEGYYDGVGFHRVIDGFMVQGGDPAGTGCGREDCLDPSANRAFPGYNVPDEFAMAEQVVADEGGYPAGSLAMANTGQPDTGGGQFFIVEAEDGYPLPPEYTLFGQVVEGQDVVEAIALGPVTGDQADDPVVMTSVTIETS